MKYFKKNIILLVFLLLAGFVASSVFAAPGDSTSPLIHVGSGDQVVSDVRVGGSANTSAIFDVNESGKNAVFDGSTTAATDANASLFTVLYNAWMQNVVFVGKNTISYLNPNYQQISPAIQASSNLAIWTTSFPGAGVATLQKINIFGGILSTNFNTAAGNTSGNAQVCVDANGTLVFCP